MVNIAKDKVGYLVILFGVIFLPGCAKKQYPQGLTKAETVIYDVKAIYKEVAEEFAPGLKILTIEDEKKKEVELSKVIFAKNKEWKKEYGLRALILGRSNVYDDFPFSNYREHIYKKMNELTRNIKKLKRLPNYEEYNELASKSATLTSKLRNLVEYIDFIMFLQKR